MAAQLVPAEGAAQEIVDDGSVADDLKAVVDAMVESVFAQHADAINTTDRNRRINTRRTAGRTHGLVSVFVDLGVATLSEQQRLELAQDLIGTVTGHDADRREKARAEGRESIFSAFDVLDSKEVSRILAPTSAPARSVAQKRRKAGELIGLPVGKRPDFRYPDFQFDRAQQRVRSLVAHANRRLDVANDPYGAASWWLTPADVLDDRSPLEDLEAGILTEVAIDNVLDDVRRGM
ncbi:hypothetical protein [Tomitella fengzijianii]|uniref:Uncharacterized protein n=1 Tax=Tomitella fengzijianii TaxID=2597660 RepID=A0A516X6I2_9ACTN|nr:hypothetical protein [Tomitella fengzijianii]QDQ98684.1 hypothetical protein FO059_16820 [Tomitella fengzijianii]